MRLVGIDVLQEKDQHVGRLLLGFAAQAAFVLGHALGRSEVARAVAHVAETERGKEQQPGKESHDFHYRGRASRLFRRNTRGVLPSMVRNTSMKALTLS